jgi:hypothetical protein
MTRNRVPGLPQCLSTPPPETSPRSSPAASAPGSATGSSGGRRSSVGRGRSDGAAQNGAAETGPRPDATRPLTDAAERRLPHDCPWGETARDVPRMLYYDNWWAGGRTRIAELLVPEPRRGGARGGAR